MDLGPILLRGSKVIIDMDWLSPNGVEIECAQQLVRVRTPSGGELVILGERSQRGPTLCSAAKARRYLQQGLLGLNCCNSRSLYLESSNIFVMYFTRA